MRKQGRPCGVINATTGRALLQYLVPYLHSLVNIMFGNMEACHVTTSTQKLDRNFQYNRHPIEFWVI